MPTQLPHKMPKIRQGIKLWALLGLFRWYGYRRQSALRRSLRTKSSNDCARWERAVRRWLDCSSRIANLLGEPEPPEVVALRAGFDELDIKEPRAHR